MTEDYIRGVKIGQTSMKSEVLALLAKPAEIMGQSLTFDQRLVLKFVSKAVERL